MIIHWIAMGFFFMVGVTIFSNIGDIVYLFILLCIMMLCIGLSFLLMHAYFVDPFLFWLFATLFTVLVTMAGSLNLILNRRSETWRKHGGFLSALYIVGYTLLAIIVTVVSVFFNNGSPVRQVVKPPAAAESAMTEVKPKPMPLDQSPTR